MTERLAAPTKPTLLYPLVFHSGCKHINKLLTRFNTYTLKKKKKEFKQVSFIRVLEVPKNISIGHQCLSIAAVWISQEFIYRIIPYFAFAE